MLRRTFASIASMLLFLTQPACADPVPPVFVTGETDDAGMNRCNLTYSSATAAVEATLRYNRIPIATQEDFLADRAIEFYVNINAFEITRADGVGTGSCAIGLYGSLETAGQTYDPIHKNMKLAEIHYCNKLGLLVLHPIDAQQKINDTLMQYANQCISEYAKLRS